MKKQKKKAPKAGKGESEGMSKAHMKEYKNYSPSQLKKHMADEKVLLSKKKGK
jgi:hypothetical protein